MTESGNTTDVVNTSPSALELSRLLEKQNKMLSALLGELETCKSEVLVLRNKSFRKISGNDTQDKKGTYTENSFKGTSKIRDILPDKSENSLISENFLEELKMARLKAENLSQELEITKTELSHAIEMDSLKQTHIDHLNELMEKERETRNNEFSNLNDLLVDKTRECDSLNAENNAVKTQLKILEDSIAAKEKLINDLTTATAKELAKRDGEDKVLAARLSVLVNENMTLRTSLNTLGANELSPHHIEDSLDLFCSKVKKSQKVEESEKLLQQQKDFIETLKSECEILMSRLVKERDKHRKERKQLKRQIRALNARLDCFISGRQEITGL